MKPLAAPTTPTVYVIQFRETEDGIADTTQAVDTTFLSATVIASATSYAACHAVFNTTELLEAIIVCLPPIKIFEVRRVCSAWLNTIGSSIQIQQKAFLSPLSRSAPWICRADVNLAAGLFDTMYSNMEIILAPTGDFEKREVIDGIVKDYCSMRMRPAVLCPLSEASVTAQGVGERLVKNVSDEWRTLRVAEFMQQPGSWQDMLLTNPPCDFVQLVPTVVHDTTPEKTITASMWMTDNKGLTVGDIVKDMMSIRVLHGEIETKGGETEYIDGQIKSINDILADLGTASSEEVKIKSIEVDVEFKGMVLPTEEERVLVENGGIKIED